jgi:CRISPR/Cas system-associated exonuclease Cas4 (RecB family)
VAGSDPEAKSVRFPARVGDHPEQELVAKDLRLTGRLDLLQVTSDGALITDFKTGVENEAHHDQLRLYALLWHLDSEVNPDGIPVTSLVAAYPSHELAVAVPDVDELTAIAETTKSRIAMADSVVASKHPEAVVGEQCGLCSVRVLCEAYWERIVPDLAEVPDGSLLDLEVSVLREHGVKSWVVRDSGSGREVLVRTHAPSITLPLGKVVRVLGARRTVDPDEEGVLIASFTGISEMFQLAE